MDIAQLQAGWEELGRRDPMWAVLTDPARQGRRWTPADFLASGEAEIATVLDYLHGLGLAPAGRALDFGCGAGRLTQALARRFSEAHGVDIARTMLAAAESLGPPPNVTFHHNITADLRRFGDDSFDFLYSSIVLQHMPSALALGYVREFTRVVRPGGVVAFQVADRHRPAPSTLTMRLRRVRVRLALGTRLRRARCTTSHTIEAATLAAHATPEASVRDVLTASRASIIDIALTNSLELDFNGRLLFIDEPAARGWVSKQYTVAVGDAPSV